MTNPISRAMNVRRFTAKTARDALRLVREALGDDAVVLSTKPSGGGVEVLAMPASGLGQIERYSSADGVAAAPVRSEPALAASTAVQDAERLEMSTLSFQDYVRKRMLRRRQAAIAAPEAASSAPEPAAAGRAAGDHAESAPVFSRRSQRLDVRVDDATSYPDDTLSSAALQAAREAAEASAAFHANAASGTVAPVARTLSPAAIEAVQGREPARTRLEPPPAREPIRAGGLTAMPSQAGRELAAFDAGQDARADAELLAELRSMKGMIEDRFGALAFMERLQRRPIEARLTQRLLDCGFSPALVRRIAGGLGTEIEDENAWVAHILEQNVHAADKESAIEERSGVFALIGATGVGKTTTTAKIAAAFAGRHGAGQLGLVTLDAYRVGAHEQLRAYGRILGVPVHTAHDRASLEDLLDLLAAKKMVLIDTAGMAQRDVRTQELLEMVSHRAIQRLLVVNAASQGETTEDVLVSYKAHSCAGVVLSKIDEAVKLGPTLDAAIRHKLRIVGVANGQRVPEDWHRLSANALVLRALRGGGTAAWRFDACETQLVFAAPMRGSREALAARATA